ncbi:MAG TPA: acyl-CoA dehydrogenase family protein, partial [Paracoccaceae bacterium]|nr:acyl-CoA dehydrogenase family protein [Paracoccaceae bacterium]
MTALSFSDRAARLPDHLVTWLDVSADGIDTGEIPAADVLPQLASAGVTGLGLPGASGRASDPALAVQAVAAVAEHSLAAAFMLWGQRSYAEFLLKAENAVLRQLQLPAIAAGEVAGASALSNVMKHLAGFEKLQVTARSEGDDLVINGRLPWVTNLRRRGFFVATAADPVEGGPTMIVSLAHDDPGLVRSDDLPLMGMCSSDTAALSLTEVRIPRDRIIAHDARIWLSKVRPVFTALQCGMAIGVARRSLAEARTCRGAGREILGPSIDQTARELAAIETQILGGLRNGSFDTAIERLFELRITLAELA